MASPRGWEAREERGVGAQEMTQLKVSCSPIFVPTYAARGMAYLGLTTATVQAYTDVQVEPYPCLHDDEVTNYSWQATLLY